MNGVLDMPQIGKMFIFLGVLIIVVGIILVFAGRIPIVGRLPGDIAWKRGNFTLYIPIGTSIVLSVIFTVLLYIISKVWPR